MKQLCILCNIYLLVYVIQNAKGETMAYVNNSTANPRQVTLSCSVGEKIRIQKVDIRQCFETKSSFFCSTNRLTNMSIPATCDGRDGCQTFLNLPLETTKLTVIYDCIGISTTHSPTTTTTITTPLPTTRRIPTPMTTPTTTSSKGSSEASPSSTFSAVYIGIACGAGILFIILIVIVICIVIRYIRRRAAKNSPSNIDKMPVPIKPQNTSRPPLPSPRPTSETMTVGGDYIELVDPDSTYFTLEHVKQQP